MSVQCPKCHQAITSTATKCERCGWQIKHERLSPGAKFDVEQTIQKVMDDIENQEYASALMTLDAVIEKADNQSDGELFALRGFVQLKLLDFERAESDCTLALSRDWTDAQTYAWRAAARGEQNKWKLAFDDLDQACLVAVPERDQYLDLMASYAITASEYFRERIQKGLANADLFSDRGWMYFRSGNYAKAERDFQLALKQLPEHAWACLGMAELLAHFDNLSSVAALCEKSLKGDVACQRATLKFQIELCRRAGQFDRAQRLIDGLSRLALGDPPEMVECAVFRSNVGDHVKAIDELNEILNQYPDLHLPILVRGDCYAAMSNPSLAIDDYTQYLRINPQDLQALLKRARAFYASKKFAAAHADLDLVQASDDNLPQLHLLRSKICLEENRLNDALSHCRQAVRFDNSDAEVFAILASVYHRLQDYSHAIEEYSRSIQLASETSDQAQYLYLRGICYYEIEEFDKAFSDFRKSCKRRPFHAGGWIWKAAVAARQEKWADAIIGLQQAILVRPSAAEQYHKLGRPIAEKAVDFYRRQQQRGDAKVDLFRHRGLALQFLGRDREAIDDYTQVLQREPEDREILLSRGEVYTRMLEYDAADQDFTRILRSHPDEHRALYGRAIVRVAENKLGEAKADLAKAIQLAPDTPRYHLLMGELAQQLGEIESVISSFDRAIKEDPSNPVSYRKRGEAHQTAGRHLQAIRDFTHSLELNPVQLEVLVQRGHGYLLTGQPVMAIEDFELALTHDERLVKAYSGRAEALLPSGKFEYILIWLTKAFHRFEASHELAEIVLARGKVFFQMGRFAPAIADFSAVMEMCRDDSAVLANARYARAVAEFHADQFSEAQRDFRKLAVDEPANKKFVQAVRWLAAFEKALAVGQTEAILQQKPAFLKTQITVTRPTRPPVVRRGVRWSQQTLNRWEAKPLYDSWVIRTEDKREYGPVPLHILQTWAEEGRLEIGMKILRADWSKWKRIEKIFTEITPLESSGDLVEEFPEIDVRRWSPRNAAD